MVKFISAKEYAELETPEYILIVGYSSSGKSHSILELSRYWSLLHPKNKVYFIDNDGGIQKELKESYSDLENLFIVPVFSVQETIDAVLDVENKLKLGDFFIFESIGRLWENTQDEGLSIILGMPTTKDEYISKWIESGAMQAKKSPVPHPDQYWMIVKNLYNRNIMDVIHKRIRYKCHVLCTTTLPPMDRVQRGARAEIADILGINVAPDGSPRTSNNFDTIIMLWITRDGYFGKVLKDRGFKRTGRTFEVSNVYLNLLMERQAIRTETKPAETTKLAEIKSEVKPATIEQDKLLEEIEEEFKGKGD